MSQTFRQEPLTHIRSWLRQQIKGAPVGTVVSFQVLDPDLSRGHYAGELLTHAGQTYRGRSHKNWLDLAETLDLRYLTPRPAEGGLVELRFEVVDQTGSPHDHQESDRTEKYGVASPFYRIDKREEPQFLHDYQLALEQISIRKGDRILELGMHRGDALMLLLETYPQLASTLQLYGVDHCRSAVADASARLASANADMICANLDAHTFGDESYHLLMAIGVLHSPHLNGKALLERLLKQNTQQRASVILGWPNMRYLDGEIKYGARKKNDRQPELSLVVKDLNFYMRLLQKRGFQTTLRGKYYLFLTGVRR